jgi:hypothetical protein
MKTALIVLLSCATLSLAQDAKVAPKDTPQTPSDSPEYKRLASVTWDLDSHKLVWVVQKGSKVNGEFIPKSADRYEVSPSEAAMGVKDEKRPIAKDEASSLFDLLSVLSLYCVESTEWWEAGGGLKPDTDTDTPPPVNSKPDNKGKKAAPVHVDQEVKPDAAQPKPAPKLIPGAMVAATGNGK